MMFFWDMNCTLSLSYTAFYDRGNSKWDFGCWGSRWGCDWWGVRRRKNRKWGQCALCTLFWKLDLMDSGVFFTICFFFLNWKKRIYKYWFSKNFQWLSIIFRCNRQVTYIEYKQQFFKFNESKTYWLGDGCIYASRCTKINFIISGML